MLELYREAPEWLKIGYMVFILWGIFLLFDGIAKVVRAINGTPDKVYMEIKEEDGDEN